MQDLEGRVIKTTSGKKYVLTDMLGEGAQGVVYNEASDKFLIKLYKKSNSIQQKNRMNKLRWLIQQDYPDQFIRPIDLIEEPYIGYIMEKVQEHTSLNKLLVPSRDVSFSEWYNKETGGLRRRLFLGYKIAMQFALLHDSNRAYCDISGSNIMVNQDPSIASVCMIDIDNIYIPGGDSGNVLGTSRYMAPEIMNKQLSPDIFTDDYSLAVILFELLRVGHPYVGDMVEDGTPEQQTQAYLGLYPYEDDPEEDSNRSSQMLPIDVVTSNNLRDLFRKTFVDGKENRMERASARDFAIACLEASNRVMKCPACGCWHMAKVNSKKQYTCPWCDDVNEKPMFIQFKDRYDISKIGKTETKEVFQDVIVNSFVLRDEKNDVTNNYISNFYIKRDKFAKPVEQYFTIRKAKDGKFYILNPSGNELYVQKAKTDSKIQILDKPIAIGRGDMIFFQDVDKLEKTAVDKASEAVLFRYGIIR